MSQSSFRSFRRHLGEGLRAVDQGDDAVRAPGRTGARPAERVRSMVHVGPFITRVRGVIAE